MRINAPCPSQWLNIPRSPSGVESGDEIIQPAGGDRVTHPGHQLLEIMQVVPGQEHPRDHLASPEHVMQIGARIAGAGRACAFGIQRAP